MKRVLKAINQRAASALNCAAVSIDDENIIRPSIQTELATIVEDLITDSNKTEVLTIRLCYFPEDRKTKEVDLINVVLKLSKAFDTPLDCEDFKVIVIHREYSFTQAKEVLMDLTVTFDMDIEQPQYSDMAELKMEVY